MDIWTVMRACARRWYVFVPILGLSLVVGNALMQSAEPVYTATSTATLTGPALVPGDEAGEVIEVNPFENLGGSLNTTTEVMVSLMNSDPKRLEFFDLGIALDYEVDNQDAVIYFDVSGADAQEVTATAVRLVEILDDEIAALQSKPVEAPEARIRAVPLAMPTEAAEDNTPGLRLLAVVGALGLVLAVAGALTVEGAVRYRRQRAESRPAGSDPDVDAADARSPHPVWHAAELELTVDDDVRNARTTIIPAVRPTPDATDGGPADDEADGSHDTLAPEVVGQAGRLGHGA